MSGDVIVSGAPLPTIIPDIRIDGSARSINTVPEILMYINVGFDKENEFVHIFDQAAAPVLGNIPRFALGGLKLGGMGLYHFGPTGTLFFFGLAFGMSTTLATFTPTGVPADYLVTFGRMPAP